MFAPVSYHQKNKLLLPLAAIVLILCWFLAFGKTYDAMMIRRDLKDQASGAEDLSFNPAYSQRKLAALQKILKSYQVSRSEWGNELWMKASAIALKEKAGIEYAITPVESDTASIGKTETIYCYGNYVQLIKLIDAIENTKGIGVIAGLQIKAPKKDVIGERASQCVLQLKFNGLANR